MSVVLNNKTGIPEVIRDRGKQEKKCSYVSNINASERCNFVRSHCHLNGGYFHYLQLPYCALASYYRVGWAILAIWLIYLFIILGVTADEFFCPCLHSLAKILHMSDSVAGVTLLAFGNGAPDIFSVIAAVTASRTQEAAMGFQELFGAGIFVSSVVAGCIHLKVSFRYARRPFLRDVLFYLAAISWTFAVIYRSDIHTREAIGFIVLYVIYVLFVVIGQMVNRRLRANDQSYGVLSNSSIASDDLEESARFLDSNYARRAGELESSIQNSTSEMLNDPELDMLVVPPFETFTSRLIGISLISFQRETLLWKIFSIFKVPVVTILNLTIPVVDIEVQGHRFNKHLLMIQCLLFPTMSLILTQKYDIILYDWLSIWHCSLALGFAMFFIVTIGTSPKRCPRLYPVFTIAGFVMSVIWIYAMANEVVNLLQSFGIAFGLSDALVGLTFLAWGNSIGDFVSNLAVASHGSPRMAIAACYGGPLLNMLLGIGISCTVSAADNGNYVKLIHGKIQYIISAGVLALILLSTLIFLTISRFNSNKYFSIYLFILYAGYISVSVLIELKIIQW